MTPRQLRFRKSDWIQRCLLADAACNKLFSAAARGLRPTMSELFALAYELQKLGAYGESLVIELAEGGGRSRELVIRRVGDRLYSIEARSKVLRQMTEDLGYPAGNFPLYLTTTIT